MNKIPPTDTNNKPLWKQLDEKGVFDKPNFCLENERRQYMKKPLIWTICF